MISAVMESLAVSSSRYLSSSAASESTSRLSSVFSLIRAVLLLETRTFLNMPVESVAGTERKDSRELGTFQPGLRELQEVLNLTPIRNPGEYVRTIGQVSDCSRIRQ